jgi:hypothetical protein
MSETKYVKLDKISTTMFMPTEKYSHTIKITEWEYNQLCKRLGSYGISWYFTETGSVKYFYGDWCYGNYRDLIRGYK